MDDLRDENQIYFEISTLLIELNISVQNLLLHVLLTIQINGNLVDNDAN